MSTPSPTTISYDRATRQWVAENGQVIGRFPAGPDGHALAERTALRHDDPDLYAAAFHVAADLYRDRPELAARTWRAARIVLDGGVWQRYPLADDQRTAARVKSQAGNGHYAVIEHAGQYTCSCPDYVDGHAPQNGHGRSLCKHILALFLSRRLHRQPAAWPPTDLATEHAEAVASAEAIAALPESKAIMARQRARARGAQLAHMSREQQRQAPAAEAK